MCLGVPGKVVEINEQTATVDFWGARRQVYLVAVNEPVFPGDYVLVHVGFAIRRIPPDQIAETLAFYDMLVSNANKDLMTQDIQAEMAALEHK